MQLLFWPTPYSVTGSNASTITSAPGPVISVGPDGYTFSSPSAYLIYSGLSAVGGVGSRLGPVINNLTLSYAPGELSTINSCDLPSGLSALIPPTIKTQVVNFQDFNIPPRWSVIDNHMNCDYCGQRYQYNSPQHSGNELVTGYASMDFGQIHWLGNGSSSWTLEPTIAHPAGITDADPMWKQCTSLFWGVWDPPRVLSPVAAVSPNDPTSTVDPTITPDPQVQISTKAIAQPASGVTSMNGLPTKTSAPILGGSESHTQQAGSAGTVDPKVVPDRNTAKSEDPAATVEPTSKVAQDPNDDASLQSSLYPSADLSNDLSWTLSNPTSSSEVGQVADPGADPASTVHLPKIIFPGQGDARTSDRTAATHLKTNSQSKGTQATYAADPLAMQDIEVSLGSSGLQIGSTIVAIPKAGSYHTASQGITPEQSSDRVFTVAGAVFTAAGSNQLFVQGHTLEQGSRAITIDGLSGLASAKPALSAPFDAGNAVITAASKTFTLQSNGQVVADGVTLAQGSSATVVDGKTMSLGPSAVIIGSSTISLPLVPTEPSNFITIGSKTFTLLGNGQVVGDEVTLAQGSSATVVDGKTMSVGTSEVMIGSSTIPLAFVPSDHAKVITVESKTFTLLGNGQMAGDGVTLIPGSPATVVNENTMSLGVSVLIIGSSTIPLPSASESSAVLGNIIMSAFGAHSVATPSSSSANASSSGLMPFTGSAPNVQQFKLAHVVFGVTLIASVSALI